MNHIHILSQVDILKIACMFISPLLRKINNHWKTNDSVDLLNQPSMKTSIMDQMIDSDSVLGSSD